MILPLRLWLLKRLHLPCLGSSQQLVAAPDPADVVGSQSLSEIVGTVVQTVVHPLLVSRSPKIEARGIEYPSFGVDKCSTAASNDHSNVF